MSGPATPGAAFMKARTDWETPPWLFDLLHAEFTFDVDAAASPHNAKLPEFWTSIENGLQQSWRSRRVWCNPPYGVQTGVWVEKAWQETRGGGCQLAVVLVPANTETHWFADLSLAGAAEIRFIRKRIHFLLHGRKCPNSRPVFASAVLIFREGERRGPCITSALVAPDPKTLQDGVIVGLDRGQRGLFDIDTGQGGPIP